MSLGRSYVVDICWSCSLKSTRNGINVKDNGINVKDNFYLLLIIKKVLMKGTKKIECSKYRI